MNPIVALGLLPVALFMSDRALAQSSSDDVSTLEFPRAADDFDADWVYERSATKSRRVPRPDLGRSADIGLSLGAPLAGDQRDNMLPYLGVSLEILTGNRWINAGGGFTWAYGSIDAQGAGVFRLGPLLQLSTPLSDRFPSLYLSGAAGMGISYSFRSKEPETFDEEDEALDKMYPHAYLAPGAGVVWPLTHGSRRWIVLSLVAQAELFHVKWLSAADERALDNRYVEGTIAIRYAYLSR